MSRRGSGAWVEGAGALAEEGGTWLGETGGGGEPAPERRSRPPLGTAPHTAAACGGQRRAPTVVRSENFAIVLTANPLHMMEAVWVHFWELAFENMYETADKSEYFIRKNGILTLG